MQYQIVKTMTWNGLARDVNNLIQEGWTPQGGASVDSSGSCIQAMIKN